MSYESEMKLLVNLGIKVPESEIKKAMIEKGLDENDPIARARITMELIDKKQRGIK